MAVNIIPSELTAMLSALTAMSRNTRYVLLGQFFPAKSGFQLRQFFSAERIGRKVRQIARLGTGFWLGPKCYWDFRSRIIRLFACVFHNSWRQGKSRYARPKNILSGSPEAAMATVMCGYLLCLRHRKSAAGDGDSEERVADSEKLQNRIEAR